MLEGRGASGAAFAAPADSEESQLVIGDPEPVGLLDAATQPRQDVRLEQAAFEILDVAAPPADHVVMVRHEWLRELVTALTLGRVCRPHQPDVAEKLHRSVN